MSTSHRRGSSAPASIKMMLAFLAASVISMVPMKSADLPDGVKPGDIAPNFILNNVDGKRVGLASYLDAKGVILVFTCNHCPYSVKYEDRIIALHKAFGPKGFPVLAINPNDTLVSPEDSFTKMQERAQEKSFPFPYLFDADQNVAKAYGARRTPHVFLLKRTPKHFIVEYIGAIDDNPNDVSAVDEKFVEKAIAELVEGKPVTTQTTKAIGCTIKWKK